MDHGTDVIFMRMGDDEADEILLHLFDETRIGDDYFNTGFFRSCEADAAINHEPFAALFWTISIEREIHADLAKAPKRHEDQFILSAEHQPPSRQKIPNLESIAEPCERTLRSFDEEDITGLNRHHCLGGLEDEPSGRIDCAKQALYHVCRHRNLDRGAKSRRKRQPFAAILANPAPADQTSSHRQSSAESTRSTSRGAPGIATISLSAVAR